MSFPSGHRTPAASKALIGAFESGELTIHKYGPRAYAVRGNIDRHQKELGVTGSRNEALHNAACADSPVEDGRFAGYIFGHYCGERLYKALETTKAVPRRAPAAPTRFVPTLEALHAEVCRGTAPRSRQLVHTCYQKVRDSHQWVARVPAGQEAVWELYLKSCIDGEYTLGYAPAAKGGPDDRLMAAFYFDPQAHRHDRYTPGVGPITRTEGGVYAVTLTPRAGSQVWYTTLEGTRPMLQEHCDRQATSPFTDATGATPCETKVLPNGNERWLVRSDFSTN
jgi:hypothetical protein